MRFGCCCTLEDAPIAAAAGFDYVECRLTSLLPDEDEAAFAPVLAQYQAASLPVQAFNVFLPADLKVTGPLIDRPRQERYVERALARAKIVGAEVIVFGSGGARNIPEGFSKDQAVAQIVTFLQLVGDEAAAEGLTIAIEPLRQAESNVINTVAQGVEIARQVERDAVRVLADFYHMDEEREPLEHLARYKDWLAHVHVADTGRFSPGSGSYPYPEFAARLRKAGYNSRISIECRWNDFAVEAPAALKFLQHTFAG